MLLSSAYGVPLDTIERLEDIPVDRIEAYWQQVEIILTDVFDRPDAHDLATYLRRRLLKAGAETQFHFYHADPFQVAADSLEMPENDITDNQRERYFALLADQTLVHQAQ